MNNLNKIFGLVQKHCGNNAPLKGNSKLQAIASEVGVSSDRLHFYLECLHEIGLVIYEPDSRVISLTEKGAKARYVFPG